MNKINPRIAKKIPINHSNKKPKSKSTKGYKRNHKEKTQKLFPFQNTTQRPKSFKL